MNIVMHKDEIALLEAFMSEADSYFEFGMGGSTCLAARTVKSIVHAVDTNPAWVDKVRAEIGSDHQKQIRLTHIDVGPTGGWGTPVSKASEAKFPAYSKSIAEHDFRRYDLCLVDGRFRVACALQALQILPGHSVIAVHDYAARPQYHMIEKYGRVIASRRQLKMLVRRDDCDMSALGQDLELHRTNWD